MSFFEEVYKMCKEIPKGRVATYGQIAFLVGNPKAARQVGWSMRSCSEDKNVPCHRILDRTGKLKYGDSLYALELQKKLLEDEGILVNDDYTVNLKKYLWNP